MNVSIECGFTFVNDNGIDVPQYLIFGIILTNASLKPNEFLKHLKTSHLQYKNKNRGFF